ncbi:MAG: hypothetical protein QOJ09_961 [Actinomycetota bacterium]|jgi:hypothetical protein|nr:hypothetical protein [Actinomycetota bacterium]
MTDDVGTWEALTPTQVAVMLGPFDGPWWIAGGVALDLYVGTATREHHDIDVAVFRDHWPAVADALPGWDFRVGTNEAWARRTDDGPWLVEFLLEDRAGPDWVYRRHPEVTLPIADVGLVTEQGIPFERPEVVLLYKAKYSEEPRHEADLVAVLPKMGIGARAWLVGALDVAHPGHPWMNRIL